MLLIFVLIAVAVFGAQFLMKHGATDSADPIRRAIDSACHSAAAARACGFRKEACIANFDQAGQLGIANRC